MKLISVVLSGGAGTRLWPASRQAYPKPFMKLGGSALLEQAIACGRACGTDDVLIVTHQDHLFQPQNLVAEMSSPPSVSYLLEPEGRNTAPAIALAALAVAQQHGPDAVMLVLAANHLIPDTSAFVANVLEATRHAQQGRPVVFGLQPTRPKTVACFASLQAPCSTHWPSARSKCLKRHKKPWPVAKLKQAKARPALAAAHDQQQRQHHGQQ